MVSQKDRQTNKVIPITVPMLSRLDASHHYIVFFVVVFIFAAMNKIRYFQTYKLFTIIKPHVPIPEDEI